MPALSFNAKAVWFFLWNRALKYSTYRDALLDCDALSIIILSDEKYTKHYYQHQTSWSHAHWKWMSCSIFMRSTIRYRKNRYFILITPVCEIINTFYGHKHRSNRASLVICTMTLREQRFIMMDLGSKTIGFLDFSPSEKQYLGLMPQKKNLLKTWKYASDLSMLCGYKRK